MEIKLVIFISIIVFSCNIPARENLDKPNILFMMSDDHTSQAWGIYGGILEKYAIEDIGLDQTIYDPTRKWPTRRKTNAPTGLKRLWKHSKRLSKAFQKALKAL